MMQVASVNVGKRERLAGRSFNGETGILKRPVQGRVHVGNLGLAGDAVVNTKHHGGEDQAVYLYREEDYVWWSAQVGRDVETGSFGENLTLAGLPAPALPIGARLQFGQLLLEITAPRIPCNTLATRMGDPHFIKAFVRAGRPGYYCRVLAEGDIAAGEHFTLDTSHASNLTTVDLFRASYRKLGREEIEQFLAAPIAIRERYKLEKQLQLSSSD